MESSNAEALSRSARLADPGFAGLVDRYIGSATILRAGDGDLYTVGQPDEYFNKCALVLTPSALWAFRGRGMLGAKKPASAPLGEIEKVSVTRLSKIGKEDEVGIVFKAGARTRKGGPDTFTASLVARWQLKVYDYQAWADAIGGACGHLRPTS